MDDWKKNFLFIKESMMINENCNRAFWFQTRRPQNFLRLFWKVNKRDSRKKLSYLRISVTGLSSLNFVISKVLGNEFLKYFLKPRFWSFQQKNGGDLFLITFSEDASERYFLSNFWATPTKKHRTRFSIVLSFENLTLNDKNLILGWTRRIPKRSRQSLPE